MSKDSLSGKSKPERRPLEWISFARKRKNCPYPSEFSAEKNYNVHENRFSDARFSDRITPVISQVEVNKTGEHR